MLSCNKENHPLMHFEADHPFLFAIRETTTNTILFIGRVNAVN